MKVTVLFFGATADTVGEREVEMDIPDGAVASIALDQILLNFPALAAKHKRDQLHFSINQEYSSGDEAIENGDELAVFTAVSGG